MQWGHILGKTVFLSSLPIDVRRCKIAQPVYNVVLIDGNKASASSKKAEQMRRAPPPVMDYERTQENARYTNDLSLLWEKSRQQVEQQGERNGPCS
jgi:hypothetical protein